MKKKYQNLFFLFGLAVLIVMVTQLDFKQVWQGIRHAGYWFFAVVVLWFFLYMFNTAAWYIIIKNTGKIQNSKSKIQNYDYPSAKSPSNLGKSGSQSNLSNQKPPLGGGLVGTPTSGVPFHWLYKITVSGFALNYATPGGLMGGEPYRIMALAPKIGTERASSSVILYAMTHIFSHFWFWLICSVLYIIFRPMSVFMWIVLSIVIGFCLLAIWFFMKGYRRGLAVSGMRLISHIPGLRRRASRFIDSHRAQLDTIDHQIASLHNQNPRTFISVVLLELTCRFASALEVFFCLLVLYASVNYLNCIFIVAFTTLFANMLFFMPLQLGGREGGFLMSTTGLGLPSSAGIFVALIVRIRELIWTAIGLLLIKLEKRGK